MTNNQKIIIPLDGISKEEAFLLAKKLKGLVWGFKVNDLLVEYGASIITELKSYGNVFADAKLHDIPNTVANGVRRLAACGADLITIHASGGRKMISQAVATCAESKILAVTVLTSISKDESNELFGKDAKDTVLALATIAKQSGAHGIVCSPEEVSLLSNTLELKSLLKVIPGIRPSWYQTADDQQRTKTPAEAIKLGADLLVIGRPIIKHKDPVMAVHMVNEEIEAAKE